MERTTILTRVERALRAGGSFTGVDEEAGSRAVPSENRQIRLRTDALEWREVEGEVVALDMREDLYLAVNRTGALLWAELTSGATPERLTSLLVERFELDRERAVADTEAFLSNLAQRDLLEP